MDIIEQKVQLIEPRVCCHPAEVSCRRFSEGGMQQSNMTFLREVWWLFGSGLLSFLPLEEENG